MIDVVTPLYRRVYRMGYETTEHSDPPEKRDSHWAWEGYSQLKRYDHGILPELRRAAGYDDSSGAGTYTEPPNVKAVWLYGELVDAYRNGWIDGYENNSFEPPRG